MRDLLRMAGENGLTVHAAHLEEDVLGMYSPDEQRIYFDIRLTPIERRWVVAHELGHHHHGHTCDSSRNELQADIYAASMLIDVTAYVSAERLTHDPEVIAEALGVTVEALNVFQRHCLTRLRGVTYVRPRLGAGQWKARKVLAHA